ncbi:MAG: hypothetical protein QOF14_3426 [Hyphomicrobiales bacterium]|jgi:hypothetical protein|nr:hypothetical protein [Hyphomicrobiales bacterium]
MLTKTKIALAAALFAATSSVAMAQGFDPNMANRYPHLANPQAWGYAEGANGPGKMQQAPNTTFQSAPVKLHQGRNTTFRSAPVQLNQGGNAGVTNDQSYWGPTEIDVDRADRASSPYAGGGY